MRQSFIFLGDASFFQGGVCISLEIALNGLKKSCSIMVKLLLSLRIC